ncbi:MAG: hypothetical protein COC15_00950 [Legionellales bacterium]|nr:MAG: hypothetical protein COC15_00950 [Legionellales bacterium]
MENKILPEQQEFYDVNFSKLNLSGIELRNRTFENCEFTDAHFKETIFSACKFVDCEFKFCDLSNAKFNNTIFNETIFIESKLIGINWTMVRWPYIKLSNSIKFYQSNLSHCSFYALDLQEIVIEDCKAWDVDFRGGNFSNSSFIGTDFTNSIFIHTKLRAADFTAAINYNINPNENEIHKAKFSMPDALSLLDSFEIDIQT